MKLKKPVVEEDIVEVASTPEKVETVESVVEDIVKKHRRSSRWRHLKKL